MNPSPVASGLITHTTHSQSPYFIFLSLPPFPYPSYVFHLFWCCVREPLVREQLPTIWHVVVGFDTMQTRPNASAQLPTWSPRCRPGLLRALPLRVYMWVGQCEMHWPSRPHCAHMVWSHLNAQGRIHTGASSTLLQYSRPNISPSYFALPLLLPFYRHPNTHTRKNSPPSFLTPPKFIPAAWAVP